MNNRIGQIVIFATAAAVVLLAPSSARAQGAEATYKAKCVSCHGTDGKGDTPMAKKLGVRDFGSPEVKKETDEELAGIIQNGKNKMPSYKSLKTEEIKDLVTYIHTLSK